jgi:hypothetical protein
MEEKIKLIDEIVKRHPSYGTEKGWAWYEGGMRDTGDWEYRKMLNVPIEELQAFLIEILRQEAIPEQQLTEQEKADSKIILEIKVGDNVAWINKQQWDAMNKFRNERMQKILPPYFFTEK